MYKYEVVNELMAIPTIDMTNLPKYFERKIEKETEPFHKIILYKSKQEECRYLCTKCNTWHTISTQRAYLYRRKDKMVCESCNSTLEVIYPHNRIEPIRLYFESFTKNKRNEVIVRFFYYEKIYSKELSKFKDAKLVEIERVNLDRDIAISKNTAVNMQRVIYHTCYHTKWKRDRNVRYWEMYPCRKENVVQSPANMNSVIKGNGKLKYSCLDLALKKGFDLIEYLKIYAQYPKVEMLLKLNKTKMLAEVIKHPYSNNCRILGSLTKSDIRFIQKHDPSYSILKTYQSIRIDEEELLEKASICRFENYRGLYFKATPKIIEYCYEQYKNQNLILCNDYEDYLSWCKKLGMDLKNKKIIFPNNFKKAHDEVSAQYEVLKNEIVDKKIREYSKTLENLSFEQQDLLIRPVFSQKEMIEESKKLCHCVRTYAEAVAKRETSIFVIRKKKEPNEPYVTLELKKEVVIQCRAKSNVAPEENVREFVNDWCNKFKYRSCFNDV